MISTEKAFDMLPYVSDIYEKVDIQKYILKKQSQITKAGKQKGQDRELKAMGLGLDMFSYIMKQSPKIKEEVFQIVAILENKKIQDVKSQPFVQTIKTFKDLFSDKETIDFFKQAMG